MERTIIWEKLAARWPMDEIPYDYYALTVTPTIYLHAIEIDLRLNDVIVNTLHQRYSARTFPGNPFFQSKGDGQVALFNLLKAYSSYDLDVGYCQGMGFLAGLLLLQVVDYHSIECLHIKVRREKSVPLG